MNIIHLASGDLWAGAEVQLFHLARSLSNKQDIDLLVVLLNHGQLEEQLKSYGVKVQVLDETKLSGFSVLNQFNKLVKNYRPDIIHTHRNKENVIGGLAAKLNGIKSVRTVHGATEFPTSLLNFRRFIFNSLDRLAGLFLQQKIIAVSKELKQKLSKKFPNSKLEVIDNSVDINYIAEKSKETNAILVDASDYNIAFVGRFVPVKRPELFYDIAKTVMATDATKRFHFHMIGDGPLFNKIDERINKNKLQTNLHLHGFVANTAPGLSSMDLLVFTSEHEGLPMTLLEAMALGVPVLSSNLPSLRSVLCDGECGYILKSDEIQAFVDTIFYIQNNTSDAKAKADKARSEIEKTYNIEINVKKYLELYKKAWGLTGVKN